MNEKKICFIICTNNEFYMNECELYLEELVIPDGYEVQVLKIIGAKSMTAGYNEGMSQSDAKYKIYLHQDVFITNKNFLLDMLKLFQADKAIGLIGLVGTPYMVKTGMMWNGVRLGNFYKMEERNKKGLLHWFHPMHSGYLEVEAVDGLLMATQYDLPWREDLFEKWDFYDVSQSFEFLKAGYKVVVPGQEPVWYIHDCGVINLENYNEEREKFLLHYKEYMKERQMQSQKEYLNLVEKHVKEGYHGSETERQHLLDIICQIQKSEIGEDNG